MTKITAYARPSGAKQAVSALAKFKGKAVICGGGTTLVKDMPAGVSAVVHLQDAGLSYIKKNTECLALGAGTTFTELLESAVIKNWAGGLIREAAYRVSSHLIRNMGTIGGNMVRPCPFNHFPVVLAVLGASAAVVKPRATEIVPVEKLFAKPYSEQLGRKWLVAEFLIPASTETMHGVFYKVAKTESSWENIMLCAAVADMQNGVCNTLRVALGAAVPKPVVLTAAEKILQGENVTEELARHAAEKAAAQAGKFNAFGAPASYKKDVAPVIIRRCILAAAGQGAI